MIVLTDPASGFREGLRDRLTDVDSMVELASLSELRAAVETSSEAVVALMGPGLVHADVFEFVARAERDGRAMSAVLFLEELDPVIVRDAMRAGLVDVLTKDADAEEIRAAIRRAYEEAPAPAKIGDGAPSGRLVTVFSTKGGSGKSLVATNLGVLLAADHDVVLVDLALQSGDLAIMLQLMPEHTIAEAAAAADRLDVEAIDGYLTKHASGLRLLAAPHEPSEADLIEPGAVVKILDLLRRSHDMVIVDAPAFFTEHVLAALDVSDHIVLLASMDVPSVKNLRTALTTLSRLGCSRERVVTVMNRADSNVGLRVQEVEKSLGTKIDLQIPSSRDVPTSINRGSPLAVDSRRSPVVAAIAELLPVVSPDAGAQTRTEGRPRFLRRR